MSDTVVVGGGIGGLAAATLLRRAGRSVTLHRRSGGDDGGAALLLQPNGLAVLGAVGVVDSLRPESSELRSLRLFDERLHPIAEVAVPGGADRGHALVTPRSLVRRVLLDAAVEAGVDIVDDRPVTGVTVLDDAADGIDGAEGTDGTAGSTPTDAGAGIDGATVVAPREAVAEVRFQAGSGPETVRVGLVVGADGADSVVRSAFSDEGIEVRLGRRYLRAMVDWTVSPAMSGEHWTRRGIAGLLPCGEGRTYWYATATPAAVRAYEAGELTRFRRMVAAAHPPLLQVVNALGSLDQVTMTTARTVTVDQPYLGPLVLVGDAAHAMPPNLGQGANSALVDAGVLAWELSTREDVAVALAAYDARRTPAVRQVQSLAGRLDRLAHLTGGRRVRNAALRALPDRSVQAAADRAQQIDLGTFRAELRSLAGA